jgi:hypothetical protein
MKAEKQKVLSGLYCFSFFTSQYLSMYIVYRKMEKTTASHCSTCTIGLVPGTKANQNRRQNHTPVLIHTWVLNQHVHKGKNVHLARQPVIQTSRNLVTKIQVFKNITVSQLVNSYSHFRVLRCTHLHGLAVQLLATGRTLPRHIHSYLQVLINTAVRTSSPPVPGLIPGNRALEV